MSNTLTYCTPQLLAQGVLALRQLAIMPRLVNRSYQGLAEQRGAVINIPVPSAITARSVTPSITQNSNVDSSPTTVAVTLDRWYEAPFQMSDQDQQEAIAGFIPMQASEAIKALANDIDGFILGKHVGFYSASGAAGTTPFATVITVAASARTLLNSQLAPLDDRRGVLDPNAEGNFLVLSNILDVDKRGDAGGIIRGSIGQKLGVDWYMDQNITTFTPGVAMVTGWLFEAAATVGDTTVTMTNATASGTILVGDIFQYSSQQYVITAAETIATASLTGTFTFTFYPALKTAGTTGLAVTAVFSTAYTVNLMFHRDAFVWASRPLADIQGLGSLISSAVDPVSGVALRLELSRQFKQTTFSYDYLGGAGIARREFGTKIAG